MAIAIAKTHVIPVIASVRTTCAGTQYTVVTPDYTDVVTVNAASTACTCHIVHCEHIRTVERQQARNAAANAQRDLLTALFDL